MPSGGKAPARSPLYLNMSAAVIRDLTAVAIDVTGFTGIPVLANKTYKFEFAGTVDNNGFAIASNVNFCWTQGAGFLTCAGMLMTSDNNGGSPPPVTALGSMSKTGGTVEPNQAVIVAPGASVVSRVLYIAGIVTPDTTTTLKLQMGTSAAMHIRVNTLSGSILQLN